jgi:hypothetical protein
VYQESPAGGVAARRAHKVVYLPSVGTELSPAPLAGVDAGLKSPHTLRNPKALREVEPDVAGLDSPAVAPVVFFEDDGPVGPVTAGAA